MVIGCGLGILTVLQTIIGSLLLVGAESPDSQASSWGQSLFDAPISQISMSSQDEAGHIQLLVETKLDRRCFSINSSMVKRSHEQKVFLVYIEAKSRPDAGFDCEKAAESPNLPLAKTFDIGKVSAGTYQILNYKTLKEVAKLEISDPAPSTAQNEIQNSTLEPSMRLGEMTAFNSVRPSNPRKNFNTKKAL